MDPNDPRAEAERWIGIAAKLLAAQDFIGSKTFAIRAREFDSNNGVVDQIIAIVDTLLVADKRINNQYDWYSILQLAHLIRDRELIASQYRRLFMLLNPERNRLPFADHALRLVVEAWSVLSDPAKKWVYDTELSVFLQRLESQQQLSPQPAEPSTQQDDPVRGGSTQINTFQFFQPLPQQPQPQELPQQSQAQPLAHPQQLQAQPPAHPHQQLQHPLWQKPQRLQESHPQWQQPSLTPQQQQPRPQPSPSAQQQQLRRPQPSLQPQQQLQRPQLSLPPQEQLPQSPQSPLPPRQQQPHHPPSPMRPQQQQPQRLQSPPLSQQQLQPQQQQLPQQPLQQQPQIQQEPLQNNQHQQQLHGQPGQQQQQPLRQTTVPTEERRRVENGVRQREGSGVDINRRASHNEETDAPRFWTACPYCYYIYEYPEIYLNCALRCQNCRRAFHAAPIPNPPPIANGSGNDGNQSFCCWAFFPLGFSMTNWKKSNDLGTPDGSNWVPFSPMFSCTVNGSGNAVPMQGGYPVAPKRNNVVRPGIRGWVYKDDDDILSELSESGNDSDSSSEWGRGTYKKRKRGRPPKTTGRKRGRPPKTTGRKRGRPPKTPGKKRGRPPKNRHPQSENHDSLTATEVVDGKNLLGGSEMQDGVAEASRAPMVEGSKKAGGSNTRKQIGKGVRGRKKLDLNVEFSNEVEEHAPSMSAGNGAGEGIEGIGFFEGLDEFLSTLPILNAVGDDKAKPSS